MRAARGIIRVAPLGDEIKKREKKMVRLYLGAFGQEKLIREGGAAEGGRAGTRCRWQAVNTTLREGGCDIPPTVADEQRGGQARCQRVDCSHVLCCDVVVGSRFVRTYVDFRKVHDHHSRSGRLLLDVLVQTHRGVVVLPVLAHNVLLQAASGTLHHLRRLARRRGVEGALSHSGVGVCLRDRVRLHPGRLLKLCLVALRLHLLAGSREHVAHAQARVHKRLHAAGELQHVALTLQAQLAEQLLHGLLNLLDVGPLGHHREAAQPRRAPVAVQPQEVGDEQEKTAAVRRPPDVDRRAGGGGGGVARGRWRGAGLAVVGVGQLVGGGAEDDERLVQQLAHAQRRDEDVARGLRRRVALRPPRDDDVGLEAPDTRHLQQRLDAARHGVRDDLHEALHAALVAQVRDRLACFHQVEGRQRAVQVVLQHGAEHLHATRVAQVRQEGAQVFLEQVGLSVVQRNLREQQQVRTPVLAVHRTVLVQTQQGLPGRVPAQIEQRVAPVGALASKGNVHVDHRAEQQASTCHDRVDDEHQRHAHECAEAAGVRVRRREVRAVVRGAQNAEKHARQVCEAVEGEEEHGADRGDRVQLAHHDTRHGEQPRRVQRLAGLLLRVLTQEVQQRQRAVVRKRLQKAGGACERRERSAEGAGDDRNLHHDGVREGDVAGSDGAEVAKAGTAQGHGKQQDVDHVHHSADGDGAERARRDRLRRAFQARRKISSSGDAGDGRKEESEHIAPVIFLSEDGVQVVFQLVVRPHARDAAILEPAASCHVRVPPCDQPQPHADDSQYGHGEEEGNCLAHVLNSDEDAQHAEQRQGEADHLRIPGTQRLDLDVETLLHRLDRTEEVHRNRDGGCKVERQPDSTSELRTERAGDHKVRATRLHLPIRRNG
eukprot:Rhum_TRINITY_DN18738_c0_g1::Rhum_TRINITY_DN18738_c0_g1_i1::g.168315::m.168315